MDEKEYLEEMEPTIQLNLDENGVNAEVMERYWLKRSNDLRCSVELVQYIWGLERRMTEMDIATDKLRLEIKMLERRMTETDTDTVIDMLRLEMKMLVQRLAETEKTIGKVADAAFAARAGRK